VWLNKILTGFFGGIEGYATNKRFVDLPNGKPQALLAASKLHSSIVLRKNKI